MTFFRFLGVIFGLFFTQILLAQQDLPISLEVKNESLDSVFSMLEKEYQLSFSYSDALIADISVSQKCEQQALAEVLADLLQDTDLDFRFVEKRFILIIPKQAALPFESFEAPPKKEVHFSGIILDAQYDSPLPFANIYIIGTNTGVTSDTTGQFRFSALVGANDSLQVTYLGYESQVFLAQDIVSDASIRLKAQAFENIEIVVTEYLMDGISIGTEVGQIKISPDQIGVLPGQAEPDVLQSIQLLPGITSPNESASGLHIRGGTPDQNLILYDGIPMYHTGHFFGSISAFNPYIVDDVQVWRGGFGAQYGGRASGVVDINSTDEIPDKIHAGFGLNLTHGHAFAELPFFEKKAALIISGRRSFTDVLPTLTFNTLEDKVFQGTKIEDLSSESNESEDLTFGNGFYFYDFNAKLLAQINPKIKLEGSFFQGTNDLLYQLKSVENDRTEIDDLRLHHTGFSILGQREWNKKLRSNLRYSYARYEYNYLLDELILNETDTIFEARNRTSNEVFDGRFQWNNEWQITPQHQINGGYHYTNYQTQYAVDIFNINIENEEESYQEDASNQNGIHALYVHYTLADKKERFLAEVGFRTNYQFLEKQYWHEPRLAMQYQINSAFQIKGSAGLHHQYISQLIELGFNDLGVENQIWALSDDDDIPVIQGRQFMAGVIFQKKGWQIDIEAYQKRLFGITSFTTSFINQADDSYSEGAAYIRGIDFLVKKRWQNYRTWLSYTLSKSDYLFDEISADPFPAFNDQRHVLSWVHVLKYPFFEFSLGWNLTSGRPYTPLIGITEEDIMTDEGEIYRVVNPVISETLNSAYLPTYHRLDFSAVYTFPEKPSLWKGKIGFSVSNVYDQRNIWTRGYDDEWYLQEDIDADFVPEVLTIEKRLLRFSPNLLFRVEM